MCTDRLPGVFFRLIATATCVLPGCAHVQYVKVPTPTQYSTWTDENQRQADAMEGVRYYLPRPFLHLKQSVPVAQRVAFISFEYEERDVDGEKQKGFWLNLPEDAPTWLRKIAPQHVSPIQALAAVSVSEKKRTGDNGRQESAPAGGSPGGQPAGETEGEERPPSEVTASTGFISDTDPVTSLSDRMDVVYLPDFEEQYVIQIHGALGRADVETRLRNGWAAETFSQTVDNSNLIPYVIKQVERASSAAAGIASTWLPVAAGLPPGTSPARLADLARTMGREEAAVAGRTEEDVAELLGTMLIFKIAEVKVAQPGLYPILKPREIGQWLPTSTMVSGQDPEETLEAFLEQNQVPWIRPDMAFIPCPPFTMVGFDVTTDVFLLPAFERVDLSPSSPDTKNVVRTSFDKTTIQAALAQAADEIDSLPTAKLALQENGNQIAVEAVEGGKATEIMVRTKTAPLSAEEVQEKPFKEWLTKVFNLDNEAQVKQVKFSDDRRAVTMVISVSPGVLAEQVAQ